MFDPGRARRLGGILFALIAALLGRAPALDAQNADVVSLQQQCRGTNAQLETLCGEGALALQAGQGMVGLLAAGGAQIPGAASTFGRRFGGTPRFSLALRGGMARLSGPDVQGGTLAGGGSSSGFTTQATLAVGLLDGFSLLPTVGGLFSLDVFAGAGLLTLPDGRGFQAGRATYGVGASVGLLRESFTLPGVTVSLARRGVGDVQLGDAPPATRSRWTSIRASRPSAAWSARICCTWGSSRASAGTATRATARSRWRDRPG
jgi:hypothetical protein